VVRFGQRPRRSDAAQKGAESTALELAAELWGSYFEQVTQTRRGAPVSVQVVGRDRVRHFVRPRTLREIGYRAVEDVLELAVDGPLPALGGLRYLIPSPRRVELDRSGASHGILIEDANGTVTLISVFCPGQPLAGFERPG
jgi:hypothetical protein